MAEIIRMPLMSDTMTEGVLVEWQKKIGDDIKAGDVLAEIETDKATMELESFQEGKLIHIGVEAGATVPVNAILAILGEEGEDISAILAAENSNNGASKEPEKPATQEAPAKESVKTPPVAATPPANQAVTTPPPTQHDNERIKASPLAKRLAKEKGIELTAITGTGEGGRIVKRDVEGFVPSPQTSPTISPAVIPEKAPPTVAPIVLPSVVGEEAYEDVPNSQIRKTIARRLGESKFQAPHFYLKMSINMDAAIAARKKMNEVSPAKISFNDMIIKAAAMALRSHPDVNAGWMGDFIRFNKHIHIGMAVATEIGLLVPVIKFADNKSLSYIAAETRQMAGKARNRKLSLDEMQGDTFTISNLGMMDIEDFTAIINPPASCIMAVGTITKVPRFNEKDEMIPTSIMKVTLSCDHRVVDGAVGAAFLQTFKSLLEEPVRMMV